MLIKPGQSYKPGSVLNNHLSRPAIADRLQRPTFRAGDGQPPSSPCLVLLRVGFTRPACLHAAGELLPHHFNLTTAVLFRRNVSVALSL